MDPIDAYHILKESLDLDEETQSAHDVATTQYNEYRIVIGQIYTEVVASIEVGQSTLTLGELTRQFFNATHRQINNKIIDLPGSEFCIGLGQIASQTLQNIGIVNFVTEDMATVKISCDETANISYI